MDKKNTTERKNPIQVADRIFQTIEALAQYGSIGLLELSKELDLNKSTVHRILNSLIFMGYAKQDDSTLKYSLTFKIWDIANQVLSKIDVVNIVKPYLRNLVELSGETVHLVQIDGINAVYIDKVESYNNSIRMVSKIGKSIPLYCSGVGKALLAEMSPDDVKKIWNNSSIHKFTTHTITNFSAFCDCLDKVKLNGYALDDEENELGVRCIATCIKDHTGRPKYAFSISAPASRMDDNSIEKLADKVLNTRKQIESEWS